MPKISKKQKKLQKLDKELKIQTEIQNINKNSTTQNTSKSEALAKNEDNEYNSIKLIGENLCIPKVLQIGNKLKTQNLKQIIKVENLSNTDGKLYPRIVLELVKLNKE